MAKLRKNSVAASEKAVAESTVKSQEVKEENKKAEQKETVCTVYIQAAGMEYKAYDIKESCRKDYTAKTGKEAAALDVYINIDEKKAFYVADGEGGDEFSVEL